MGKALPYGTCLLSQGLHSKLLISRNHRGIINFPSENKYYRDGLILNLKKEI